MNRIITIGREFGSGGREVGKRLSDELGIAYYDQEIVTEIAKRTSFSEQYVQRISEHDPIPSYPIHTGVSFAGSLNPMMEQSYSIFFEQSDLIKELAEKSDCIIVGRCADYILEDKRPFKIFVYADIESRIKRCREKGPDNENLSDRELRRRIVDIDKKRAKYYEFYTDKKWGSRLNYDLMINTSNISIKEFVPVLAKLFE